MEEILASIRRIIEDNDSGPRPAGAAAPEQDSGPRQDNAVRQEGTIIEVDAFRAELRASDADKPVAEMREPAPAAAARPQTPPALANGPADSDLVPGWNAEPRSYSAPQPREEPKRYGAGAEAAATLRAAAEALDEALPRHAFAPSDAEAATPGPTPPEPADVAPAEPPVSEAAEAATHPRPVIMSERAERQVAAAFGELSEAFAARSKKTLDQMAEEMLRPMLQDWLDNNLPLLVERLVREEIERVARGA